MPTFRFLLPGIGTCLAYLVTGALGLMIAIPPSYASLLWLPAGIALGMTLQYGNRALPGVFFGSCLLHIGIAWSLSPRWYEAAEVPLLIGLGAALQAQAGAWLVKRLVGRSLPLHQPGLVVRFLLLAGPVACIINGLIGPVSMWLVERISAAQLPGVMLTWWLGDSLGVIMVLPLMLVLFSPLRESWMPPMRAVALPLLLICLGSLWAFHALSRNEQHHQLESFGHYAEMQQNSLQAALDAVDDALQALSGYVRTVPEITPANFDAFSGTLLGDNPGVQGFSWNPVVTREQRSAFEDRMRQLQGAEFGITEPDDRGRPIRAGDRDRYVVAGFIAPAGPNRAALGLDVLAIPSRASALLQAARSGQLAATGALQLVTETGGQAAILVFLPVYDEARADGGSPWDGLRGFATLALRLQDLVQQSIGQTIPAQTAVALVDPAAPEGRRLLYGSQDGLESGELERAMATTDLPILVRSQVRLGNNEWELVQYARHAYIQKPRTLYYLLSGVFLLAGLYSWLLLVLAGQRHEVQQLVAEQTRQLAHSHSMLAEAQRIAGLSQWIWRPAESRHHWSDGFRQLLGFDVAAEPSVDAFLARVRSTGRSRISDCLDDWLQGAGSREPLVCELLPVSGEVRHIELQSDWIEDAAGQPEYLSIVARDISERWQAEEQIRRLAYYDSLTGLPNRDLLHENLRQQIVQGRRGSRFGALLFIDLDNFKSLNDTLGHSIGDQLLRDVTERLRAGLREQDIISRFGGDEFLILLPCTCAHEEEAREMGADVAQKVIDLLQPAFRFGSYNHRVSASVGVTLVPQQTAGPGALIMQADTAMYHAKAQGKGRFAHYQPDMQAELVQQVQLEQELRQALQQAQLELHYQPQFDHRRLLVGVEALVRWRHPQQGLLLPGSFIGAAEDAGLLGAIGEWVLDRGVQQLADWCRAGLEVPRLSINLSPTQLNDGEFIARLDARVAAAGIEPQRLCLELTEQVLLPQASPVHQRIEALRERGYGISIDDFGTGYSSLSYLKKLPFNELKIAREFVHDLPRGRRDSVLVKTILSMARTLGVDAIAEGVESVEQFEYLCLLGCRRFQGFYLARPMPAADFEHLLNRDYAVEAEPEYEI